HRTAPTPAFIVDIRNNSQFPRAFNVRIAVTPNALGQWEGGVSHEGQDNVNCGIPPERYSCRNELTGLARAARRACALTINNAKVSAMAPVTGNIHQAISVLIV